VRDIALEKLVEEHRPPLSQMTQHRQELTQLSIAEQVVVARTK
jgi:hypothetical protein